MKKDIKFRKFYTKYEVRKKVLKSLLLSMEYTLSMKMYFSKLFSFFPKKSSLSVYRSGCVFSGLGSSVTRKFKLSRHDSKKELSFGFLPGFRKSSF